MAPEKKIKWLFTLVVLANLVIVFVVVLGALQPAPPRPMPNPNGYDDFVKAGTMLTGNAGDCSNMKQAELVTLVTTNVEALKLLRVGLSRECRVPNDYSSNYINRVLFELSSQKQLALTLCAEGRLASLQNRTNDAAESYLDCVCFGVRCCQGGIMISKLSGIACERLGRARLQTLVNDVGLKECLKISQILETLDTGESSPEDILKQEGEFVQRTARLQEKIAALIFFNERRKSRAKFLSKFQINQLERRQMMVAFAARAFELQKGKPPASVTNLVPDYLKAVPKNSVTGSNLVLGAISP